MTAAIQVTPPESPQPQRRTLAEAQAVIDYQAVREHGRRLSYLEERIESGIEVGIETRSEVQGLRVELNEMKLLLQEFVLGKRSTTSDDSSVKK